jgi:hypothetical protein
MPVSKTVTMAKVDGRSAFGRLIRQVRSDLVQHVGGNPSAVQRMMIERAATLTGYLARLCIYCGFRRNWAAGEPFRRKRYCHCRQAPEQKRASLRGDGNSIRHTSQVRVLIRRELRHAR